MAKDLYDPDFEEIDLTIDKLEQAYKELAKREDDEIDRAVATIRRVIAKKKKDKEAESETTADKKE